MKDKVKRLRDAKLRIKIIIFFICLILSISTWLIIKLSKDYVATLDYPLRFTHLQKDKVLINNGDTIIHVHLNLKGFELIYKRYFPKNNYFNIDLSNIKFKKTAHGYISYLASNEYLHQILSQSDLKEKLISVTPDTVLLAMESRAYKKVPVKLDISYDFQKQYQLYGNIKCEPDSIVISGTKADLNRIREVETRKCVFHKLIQNQIVKIPLRPINGIGKVNFSKKLVSVTIPVEKFTEASVVLPININNSEKYTIKIFPNETKINFWVALKDYRRIDPGMFSVMVNCENIETTPGKRLDVGITRYPSFVTNITLEPESVEYILLK